MEKRSGSRWWYKLGKPQYSGELVIRANRNLPDSDPRFDESNFYSIQRVWMERPACADSTLEPVE